MSKPKRSIVRSLLKFRLPGYISLLMIAFNLAFTAFVIAENAQGLMIMKPAVLDIMPSPPGVKITGLGLSIDYVANMYPSAVVNVYNENEEPVAGIAYLTLYDAQARVIATGVANSTVIPGGTKHSVTIQMEWIAGAYIHDYAYGRVGFMGQEVVQQETEEPT